MDLTTMDETFKTVLTHLAIGLVIVMAIPLVLVACHTVAVARSRR